jgi:hypothetical protein
VSASTALAVSATRTGATIVRRNRSSDAGVDQREGRDFGRCSRTRYPPLPIIEIIAGHTNAPPRSLITEVHVSASSRFYAARFIKPIFNRLVFRGITSSSRL